MLKARHAIATALLALVVTGCGDDADERGPAAGRPAETQGFVTQADAICAQANQEETKLGATGVDWIRTPLFDDPKFLAGFTAIGARALRRLKALEVPAGDEQHAATAWKAIDRMVTALEQRAADLRKGTDRRRSDQLDTYLDGYDDLAVSAGPLGLSECQGLVL